MCGLGVRSKDGCQKDVCLKEIGLRAENVMTVLSSMINMIRGWGKDLYDCVMSMRSFIQAPDL